MLVYVPNIWAGPALLSICYPIGDTLRGFTELNGKHVDMEVIVKSNDFPREET